MEIQCPSCQKKLIIDDQFAGQLTKCPSCSGVFMAPTLVTPPVMSSPPPPPDVIPFTSEPPPPRPTIDVPASSATFEPVPPPPPLPPGEFTKSRTICLCPDAIRWIMPAALTLIFIVSFFSWVVKNDAIVSRPATLGKDNAGLPIATIATPAAAELRTTHSTLWGLAFEPASVSWIFYVIFAIFLALPIAWVRLLMDMGLIPMPAFLKPFWSWRFLLLAGLVGISLLLALLSRMQLLPEEYSALGMFLGLRLHLVALIACVLDHWLETRKASRLPTPELVIRS